MTLEERAKKIAARILLPASEAGQPVHEISNEKEILENLQEVVRETFMEAERIAEQCWDFYDRVSRQRSQSVYHDEARRASVRDCWCQIEERRRELLGEEFSKGATT